MSVVNFDFLHDISLRNACSNSPQAFLQSKRSSLISIDSENNIVSQNKPKLFKTIKEETSSNDNSTALKEESESNNSAKNNPIDSKKANEFSIESFEKLLNNDKINTSDKFLEELCKILGLKENKENKEAKGKPSQPRNRPNIKLSKKVVKTQVAEEKDATNNADELSLNMTKVTIVTEDNAEIQVKSENKISKPAKVVKTTKVIEEKNKDNRNKSIVAVSISDILAKAKEKNNNLVNNLIPFNDIEPLKILSDDQVQKQNDSKNESVKEPTSTSKSIKKWSLFEDYLILVLYINYNGAWEKLLSIIKQSVTQMKRRCYYKINFHRKDEKMTLINRANNLHQEIVNQFKEAYNFSSLTHLTHFTELILGKMPNKMI